MAKEFAAAESPHSNLDAYGSSNQDVGSPTSEASYSLSSNILGASSEPLVDTWQRYQDLHSPDDPLQGPEWLKGFFEGQTNNLRYYSLRRGAHYADWCPF